MEWYERLESYWQECGLLSTAATASDESIEAFERRYTVRMPADIRLYFQNTIGMSKLGGHDTDDNGFRFLWLSEVQSVGEFSKAMGWRIDGTVIGHPSAFVFVDFLQWCGAYAFETASANAGAIYLLGGPHPRLVARSLEAFIERYLADDPSIYQF